MAILKCKMCGGTLDYDPVEDQAVCPYCGSKSTIYNRDRKLYEQFRNQFAALLDRKPVPQMEEGFFVESSREELVREDGETIEIDYLAKRRADMCTMYVAKHNIIYLFDKEYEAYARRYKEMIGRITYPSKEMERELSGYVPKLVTECRLSDGSWFLAIEKKEGVYPLGMLGTFTDRHVAWMISRLENLCCLLAYNQMVLNGFGLENLFVDPANHQIYLYGGWWFAGFIGGRRAGVSQGVPCFGKAKEHLAAGHRQNERNSVSTDLYSIRQAAIGLLGFADREELERQAAGGETQILPRPFAEFLLEDAKQDAVADFKKWDEVLYQSYGERKFIPLAMTQEEVYSRSGEN